MPGKMYNRVLIDQCGPFIERERGKRASWSAHSPDKDIGKSLFFTIYMTRLNAKLPILCYTLQISYLCMKIFFGFVPKSDSENLFAIVPNLKAFVSIVLLYIKSDSHMYLAFPKYFTNQLHHY